MWSSFGKVVCSLCVCVVVVGGRRGKEGDESVRVSVKGGGGGERGWCEESSHGQQAEERSHILEMKCEKGRMY